MQPLLSYLYIIYLILKVAQITKSSFMPFISLSDAYKTTFFMNPLIRAHKYDIVFFNTIPAGYINGMIDKFFHVLNSWKMARFLKVSFLRAGFLVQYCFLRNESLFLSHTLILNFCCKPKYKPFSIHPFQKIKFECFSK